MTNFEFKIHRVTELPTSLEAYSVYYVAPASTANYVEIYVSNAEGTSARRVINESDIKVLISEEFSKINSLEIFSTIAERATIKLSQESKNIIKNTEEGLYAEVPESKNLDSFVAALNAALEN